jgi:dihydrolipoamide dehydrogenase
MNMEPKNIQLVVVGAGPGGYAAAFYAADKGLKVLLIEQEKRLGGVCLNRGCIPSKALLHATKLISEARGSANRGIEFPSPALNLDKMRSWKESILEKLGQGIKNLAQKRNVEICQGRAYFEGSTTLRIETEEGQQFVQFEKAIIAVGSKSAMPKAFDLGNPRIMTSREALELPEVPEQLLVVGGGYIGMELGTVYARLGSKVVVLEALDSILMGADADLARPVMKYAEKAFREVRLKTKVLKMASSGKQIKVVTVGRVPNCNDFGLENTKISRDEKGFITVDSHQQTSDPSIYAIGDVAGGMLLAHKAAKEARIAIEHIAGENSAFENIIIPAVVFTDPEVAWCGLTENEAREKNLQVEVVKFPWAASGRALSFDRTDGLTKLIIDAETERVLGVGIVGAGAGELIAEGVLAIEMGATARDLAEAVHPHPTLSETIMECAELFYGHATHAFARKKAESPEQPAQ